MKNNETGEFELVLGNRQLLSGFFLVVLLFGVAFSMGYIVGRNSAPSPKAQAEAATGLPAPGDARPQAAGSLVNPPPQSADAAAPTADQPPADATPQPVTQPAREPEPAKAAAAPPPSPATATLGETQGTNFWQVMAVKRPEAEAVLKALRDKNFPASLGAGPNDLVRVLVGPYPDTQSLGRAKTELENAGFHPILKK
jgi:cell division septation protein DedD